MYDVTVTFASIESSVSVQAMQNDENGDSENDCCGFLYRFSLVSERVRDKRGEMMFLRHSLPIVCWRGKRLHRLIVFSFRLDRQKCLLCIKVWLCECLIRFI